MNGNNDLPSTCKSRISDRNYLATFRQGATILTQKSRVTHKWGPFD